jgi:hypothetical protein
VQPLPADGGLSVAEAESEFDHCAIQFARSGGPQRPRRSLIGRSYRTGYLGNQEVPPPDTYLDLWNLLCLIAEHGVVLQPRSIAGFELPNAGIEAPDVSQREAQQPSRLLLGQSITVTP